MSMKAYLFDRIKEHLARLDNNDIRLNKQDLYGRVYWARITSISPALPKPLTVKRTFEGTEYNFNCYISERIKELYLAGKIALDDLVLVCFVDGDLDQAIVFDKIIIP